MAEHPLDLTPVPAAPVALAPGAPAAAYLASQNEVSCPSVIWALDKAARLLSRGLRGAETFPWALLDYERALVLRTRLGAGDLAPATGNRVLCAVRGVAQQAWLLGVMCRDTRERIEAVPALPGLVNAPLAGRALEPDEVSALAKDCASDDSLAGARDGAILALCYGGGLRRAEACKLPAAAYNEGRLVVVGKRSKVRDVPLSPEWRKVLDRWVVRLPAADGDAHLLRAVSTKVVRGPLSESALVVTLDVRRSRLGLEPFSPHDLRRTYITELLDRGVDLLTVAKLAGHDSPKTTMRYDRRGLLVLDQAAATLDQGRTAF